MKLQDCSNMVIDHNKQALNNWHSSMLVSKFMIYLNGDQIYDKVDFLQEGPFLE